MAIEFENERFAVVKVPHTQQLGQGLTSNRTINETKYGVRWRNRNSGKNRRHKIPEWDGR